MKALLFITISLGLLLLGFSGCQDQDDSQRTAVSDAINDTQANEQDDSFLVRIDGIDLNADAVVTTLFDLGQTEVLQITGTNSQTGASLSLRFPASMDVGSYAYSGTTDQDAVVGFYDPGMTMTGSFVSQSGILNITVYNTALRTINGNSVFTLSDPVAGSVIEVSFCEFSAAF